LRYGGGVKQPTDRSQEPYMGGLPALGIMPRADRDRPGRPQSMALAHIVYGGVLAALLRRRP